MLWPLTAVHCPSTRKHTKNIKKKKTAQNKASVQGLSLSAHDSCCHYLPSHASVSRHWMFSWISLRSWLIWCLWEPLQEQEALREGVWAICNKTMQRPLVVGWRLVDFLQLGAPEELYSSLLHCRVQKNLCIKCNEPSHWRRQLCVGQLVKKITSTYSGLTTAKRW